MAYAVVALVRLLLGAALAVSALQSYRLSRRALPDLPGRVGAVLPFLLLAGAVAAFVSGYRMLRRALALRRAPIEPPPDA